MVDTGTAIGAAIGGAIAAEALGITNFSGGNSKVPAVPQMPQVPRVPEAPDIEVEAPESPGMNPAVLAALAKQKSAPTVIKEAAGGTPTVPQFPWNRLPVPQPRGSGGGDGGSGGSDGSGGGGGSGGSSNSTAGFDLQQLHNEEQGMQPGDVVATTGEAGVAIGESGRAVKNTGKDLVNSASKSGRTFGAAVELVTTGETNVNGTFDPRSGQVEIGALQGPVVETDKAKKKAKKTFEETVKNQVDPLGIGEKAAKEINKYL